MQRADPSTELCYRTSVAGTKKGSVKNTSAFPFTQVLPAECTRKFHFKNSKLPFITYWKIFSRACVYKFEET